MTRSARKARPVITTRSACSVIDDQAEIVALSQDLARAMKRLRRSMASCVDCLAGDECPVRQQVNANIQAAIQMVWDVWNEQMLI